MAKVGDKVPSATLRMLGPEGPKAVTTEELFAPGKKVVAFALPGAFTPTCSAKHVPGFVAEADKLKAKGVEVPRPREEAWGRLTAIQIPGAGTIQLYQPAHPSPLR